MYVTFDELTEHHSAKVIFSGTSNSFLGNYYLVDSLEESVLLAADRSSKQNFQMMQRGMCFGYSIAFLSNYSSVEAIGEMFLDVSYRVKTYRYQARHEHQMDTVPIASDPKASFDDSVIYYHLAPSLVDAGLFHLTAMQSVLRHLEIIKAIHMARRIQANRVAISIQCSSKFAHSMALVIEDDCYIFYDPNHGICTFERPGQIIAMSVFLADYLQAIDIESKPVISFIFYRKFSFKDRG